MADQLLPCPFCGGAPKLRTHRSGEDSMECYVECPTCEARTTYYEDAYAPTADAIDAWNRRTGDLLAYYSRQIEWSRETFGPALRTKGVIDHIRKELTEIEREPHDLSEWIDVVILAMDGFWRHGGKAEDLMPALLAKQQKNMARVWPDWRTMSEDSAIEHDRSQDAIETKGAE